MPSVQPSEHGARNAAHVRPNSDRNGSASQSSPVCGDNSRRSKKYSSSVKQVMSYGALIASQEPDVTTIYQDKQHAPCKAPTDTRTTHSRYLRLKGA